MAVVRVRTWASWRGLWVLSALVLVLVLARALGGAGNGPLPGLLLGAGRRRRRSSLDGRWQGPAVTAAAPDQQGQQRLHGPAQRRLGTGWDLLELENRGTASKGLVGGR